MDTKICSKCKIEKSKEEFYKKLSNKDGLQNNCKSCKTLYNQSHYKNNKSAYLNRRASWRELSGKPWMLHNLEEKVYLGMMSKYNGKCWVCKIRDFVQIDHDHSCCPGNYSCGKCVRGLLCINCNTSLGKLGDSLEMLMRAVNYLKEYESR